MRRQKNGSEWSKEEELIIRLYYDLLPASEIAKILCRSERAVRNKARRLGLAKKRPGKVPKHLKPILRRINDNYIYAEDK